MSAIDHRLLETDAGSHRERYQLLTSLVVPRPIGWLSTESARGEPNLAPFSYFAALAASPMLIGVSIGHRASGPKDSLRNIRETGDFCVNVVTERHLEAMNLSSGEHPPEINEFEVAGLQTARASSVEAPYVADCPAVLECRMVRDVDLGEAASTLIVGRVLAVRLDPALPLVGDTLNVDPEALRPVGRLWGAAYAMPGEVRVLPRPKV